MQLTRFTDIGLRVVMRLAVQGDGSMTTRALADDLEVPYTHVAKVVGRLSELGIVHSRRGRTGGLVITELGRTARVGWLAGRLEGEGEVVDCDGPTPCPLRAACRLRGALAAARRAFFASLDEHTVGDLVADPTGAVLLTLDLPRRNVAEVDRVAE
ncbi:Rrf2 family transcriptional regulator [Gordonia desulfuricans]|uniref:Rrf2 family transcriptional regulator n=1 Tax=Gordonia desulfuricans TaxID=89051 RepID=A0A7K3LVA1_9ACTN|nr:Rrf2 family transcriptional regulator [Gordonia desulfuricans]NDK92139.1 Rrf2 family transcriptional regulator [Gordonia desulfuricans]